MRRGRQSRRDKPLRLSGKRCFRSTSVPRGKPPMPRYKLRTLLILMAVLPPLIALIVPVVQQWLKPDPPPIVPGDYAFPILQTGSGVTFIIGDEIPATQ